MYIQNIGGKHEKMYKFVYTYIFIYLILFA